MEDQLSEKPSSFSVQLNLKARREHRKPCMISGHISVSSLRIQSQAFPCFLTKTKIREKLLTGFAEIGDFSGFRYGESSGRMDVHESGNIGEAYDTIR